MPTSRDIPVYALIIAINGDGLDAPEVDAIRLRRTLIALGVRPESIKMLLGANATRTKIIQCLLDVSTHRSIVKNAPILIYFAGHGRKDDIYITGVGKRKVLFLVPFDGLKSNNSRVPDIPDITVSALLGKIAQSKGNHITLILDCCYAGSGYRSAGVIKYGPKPSNYQPPFDSNSLEQEYNKLRPKLLSGTSLITARQSPRPAAVGVNACSFRHRGVTSHVLIASCHAIENSYEVCSPSGEPPFSVFTRCLIWALEDCQEDGMIRHITYSALFNRIQDIMRHCYDGFSQTPQLEGYHRNRYVFATSAFPHQHHAVSPIVHERGVYALRIGSLAGVYREAFFEIYDYPNGQRKLIGRFPISSLNEIRTNITPGRDLNLGPDAYAVLCTPPVGLSVKMSPRFTHYWNRPHFQAVLAAHLGRQYALTRYITPVRPRERCKLQISISQRNEIQIQTEFGSVIVIPNYRKCALYLSSALTEAAMFYHHLERVHVSPNHTSQLFEVQVLELSPPSLLRGLPLDGVGAVTTIAPHRGRDPITLRSNERCILADHPLETEFGLRILNRTNHDFFIYIFYFDPSDFSITSIYMPSSSDPIPPLHGGEELIIGCGHQGAAPLRFTIDAHLAKNTGFFKLYFSHHPAEMSMIQQGGFDPGKDKPLHHSQPYFLNYLAVGSTVQGGPSEPTTMFPNPPPPFGSVLYPITVLNPSPQKS